MPLLTVKNISKSFDGNEIIHDTSFTVDEGDTLSFVSPSGSGKSTMLAMVGLLLTPDTGEIVSSDGTNMLALSDNELARLRREMFGFVFQSTQLIGSLRAVENVMAPAYFAKSLDFSPEKRAQELLERFGLGERLYYYPHQLSVGQKRRVAVARAMMLEPKIIIADEPTNDLDEDSAAIVTDALFEYAQRGNALLFATHDIPFAKKAKTMLTMEGKSFCA